MKKLIYACFALLFWLAGINSSFAQNDFTRAKMDSLKLILAKQKMVKDSILILQKMVDVTPIVAGETASYSAYLKKLLELNEKTKLIDNRPYQLLQEGNDFWNKKLYRQALNTLQEAISEFDKQHKVVYPLLMNLRILYNFLNDQESRLTYYQKKLEYYQVNGPFENLAPCYHGIAGYYLYKGAYNQSISYYLRGADVFRKVDPRYYINIVTVIGNTYSQWGNVKKAVDYLSKGLTIAKSHGDTASLSYNHYSLSTVLIQNHQYEKALQNINDALSYNRNNYGQRRAGYLSIKADIYLKINQLDQALAILKRVKFLADSAGYKTVSNFGYMEVDYDFYQYYLKKGDTQLAEKSLLTAYKASVDENGIPLQLKYLRELANFYQKQHKPELSAKYFDLYLKTYDARETVLGDLKVAQYEIDQNDKEQREHINQLKQEKAVQDYQISRRNTLLWGSLVALLLITGLLVFIYRQLQLNKKTLISLRKTQRQLIQSEKMASLGELTAGIAHEIQNPLNFVNNFSEVSIELLEEMEAELKRGAIEDAVDIAGDVKQNLEKIGHHGKRADGIVKGMLQHSRASNGKKEPTDINTLADEYFRLAYHGLRAKDKSFNSEIITYFDENLPKATVIPQDIGRVLLNLFTNAFYSVQQMQKTAGTDYQPLVELTTSVKDDFIEIKVKDNGIGMPEHIKDKIMQPFFTTKPTGEGTGLGLSMSYDIVVKGHGGSIDINSSEGNGAEFIIKLPIQNS